VAPPAGIVERLHAELVARQHEPPTAPVPHDDREAAAERRDALLAASLVEPQHDGRVVARAGSGAAPVDGLLELPPVRERARDEDVQLAVGARRGLDLGARAGLDGERNRQIGAELRAPRAVRRIGRGPPREGDEHGHRCATSEPRGSPRPGRR
jgi:hypothetical protein